MKIIFQDKDKYVLRFDKDEEVFSGLLKFMKDQSVAACVFNAIGASSSVEIAYYNPHVKEYDKKSYAEDMEIISLTGNGGLKDGQPIIHAHGVFARNDFATVGGHVFKVVVSATAEVFFTKLNGELKREASADWNLNLLV